MDKVESYRADSLLHSNQSILGAVMFGLMKAKICSQPVDLRESRRLAYCGTCKTLGARYGQRTRFLLSHDTVFLAELLDALEEVRSAQGTDKAFRSFNCLSLPSNPTSAPFPLRFAAATTLFISEGMLEDHRQDTPSQLLNASARLLAKPFRQAEADLADWGLPTEQLRALLASQRGRELKAASHGGRLSEDESLNLVAAPTAQGMGIFFEFGARLVNRADAALAMKGLGQEFGTLIYLLDAFEDEKKDARTGEFNAFRAALLVRGEPSIEQRGAMRDRVLGAAEAVGTCIRALPIPEQRKSHFCARLHANLSSRLGIPYPEAHVCSTTTCKPRATRFQRALAKARDVTRATLQSSTPLISALLAPLVLILALPLAFFFPVWVSRETGLGGAYGLLLNMMFAGQAARVLVGPFLFSAPGPEGPPGLEEAVAEVANKAKKTGGGGCCDCDVCDCCDSSDCGDCCSSCDC